MSALAVSSAQRAGVDRPERMGGPFLSRGGAFRRKVSYNTRS
jgi:hypothetical protein